MEASKELEAALNQKIEELQKQLEIHREAEAAQLKQSEEVHLSLAGLQQQDLFIKENIARIDQEMLRLKKEAGELDQNKGNTAEEISQREEKIQDLKKQSKNPQRYFLKLRQKSRDRPKTEKR
mgnify:FL=1